MDELVVYPMSVDHLSVDQCSEPREFMSGFLERIWLGGSICNICTLQLRGEGRLVLAQDTSRPEGLCYMSELECLFLRL